MIKRKLRWVLMFFLITIYPVYIFKNGKNNLSDNYKEWLLEFNTIKNWK
jgi:hypothetical protein